MSTATGDAAPADNQEDRAAQDPERSETSRICLERLKRMYGERAPRDTTTRTLARITVGRLKKLAAREATEGTKRR